MTSYEKTVFSRLFVCLLICLSFMLGFAMGDMQWIKRVGASIGQMLSG